MKPMTRLTAAAALLAALAGAPLHAQTVYSEDFTGGTTTNSWYFFNGACLTAGTSSATASPGSVPSCATAWTNYYHKAANADPYLVGGNSGYLGQSSAPSSGSTETPDPNGSGALRFTNGSPYGHNESGAIVSADTIGTGQGLRVTFKTITYRGDSGGSGGDGADGISFFLMDGSRAPGLGAFGGSLGYTCSNSNTPHDGLWGGYLGLGIDEYGNFLNQGDNTATGYGYQPGRIGLRGAGSVSWAALNAAYGTDPLGATDRTLPYYPSSASATTQQQMVYLTCSTGKLYNYNSMKAVASATLTDAKNTAGILDYAVIPNAYTVLSGIKIANESAVKRGDGTPIFYNLQITQAGLLTLSYSISGGAYSYLIKNQSITAANGPLPPSFRFGFAGSTGGSTNIHEIMCFKAAAANQSGSSATVNEKQAAKVEAGTQAYFAYYNPNNWTGTLTANNLIDTNGVVTVNPTANWDSSCLLSGTASGAPPNGGCATTGASGPTGATPAWTNRVMITTASTNGAGIPFEWNSLDALEQAALDYGDATVTANRLSYLRGDRSNEINSSGVGLYRARDSLLGDIVDSSPTWIGPPSSPYTATWQDRLNPVTVMPENTGPQTYLQFVAAEQTRLNVVYAGANDGFLHGFRAGSFDVNGNFVASGTTPNDGEEVLAYMPGAVLASAPTSAGSAGCTNTATTGSLVQNIHGVTPPVGTTLECVDPNLDLSNSQYGHNFFVDATPGSGDLYYGGYWHTWLVGGLGIGGAAIYALDVTNPSSSNFTETNASSIVMGEWNAASIACANATGCGNNLGNTFGTPQVRRLHNGNWAVIFGNGFGSQSGDAGIFVMSVDINTGAKTFYYLSTGATGANGIAYVTPADLDGDHITDYVYAGDLKGNVWRFDLTSATPSNWAAGAGPLFTTPSGQPITSQLLVVSSIATGGLPRVLIEFGTGQRTQITNLAPASYVSGTQALYGVWDWNLSAWNTLSPGAAYASLAATGTATGLSSPYTVTASRLQAQTLSPANTNGVVEGTNVAVCWQGSTACASNDNQYGWYANLPGSSEQVIFNPVFYLGAFVVNSTVPATNVPTSCTSNLDTGFTYALSISNGGIFTNAFPTYTKNGTLVTDSKEAGIQTNATGSVYVVSTAEGKSSIVYQTISGTPGAQQVNIPSNARARRLTWIEKR